MVVYNHTYESVVHDIDVLNSLRVRGLATSMPFRVVRLSHVTVRQKANLPFRIEVVLHENFDVGIMVLLGGRIAAGLRKRRRVIFGNVRRIAVHVQAVEKEKV